MSRKIAVITGTRAEYGLLQWTMREMQARGVTLQLIVTGAHLSPAHGMTVKQIEDDGFFIAARVDMDMTGDTPLDIVHSASRALSGIADTLDKLKPDLAVILGDRYEILAAASAAAMLGVPIAHIHGGEVTEGAIDESLRHAITKLSYWHFASTEPYRQRIIQLGEDPARVFMVGAPGIDNLVRLPLLSHAAIEKELGIALAPPVILFTYHPETLSGMLAETQIQSVLDALDAFPQATVIVNGANADMGGRTINRTLEHWANARKNTVFKLSFGSLLYLSMMKEADVIAGNSSSGLIEAPALGKATVNIGNRQKGRLRAPSVIDCACDTKAIIAGIQKTLSPQFKKSLLPMQLFGTPGEVAPAIAHALCMLPVPPIVLKKFHDV